MAILSKEVIQRLAVLRALSMWQKGACGPVRVHKVLFFADKSSDAEWHFFTFKKWRLGQYSDEIADSLNQLREIGRLSCIFDGPADRLRAEISSPIKKHLVSFFRDYFCNWHNSLEEAFPKWAYLNNDAIITRAHDDPSYTRKQHGDVIFSSFESESVEFEGLEPELVERLADLVDVRLHRAIETRLASAAKRPARSEDWRKIYFGQPEHGTRRTISV